MYGALQTKHTEFGAESNRRRHTMKQRLSSIGLLLLVAVVILAGVTGCERKAKERVPEATEAADLTPSSATPGGIGTTPIAGETVVSAVTSTPGTGATPTLVPIGGTPPAEVPTATAVPVSPTQPSGGQAPTAVPEGGVLYHTVQSGETLSSIAQRYGTTWQAIASANGLVNPNQIYVGQRLKIPTTGGSTGGTSGCRISHTVRSGEWVWQIARDYGVSPYDILAANGLTIQTANTIYPGKVLCIP
jgi:LysM repeat protein